MQATGGGKFETFADRQQHLAANTPRAIAQGGWASPKTVCLAPMTSLTLAWGTAPGNSNHINNEAP
jgi:hypothetical protein